MEPPIVTDGNVTTGDNGSPLVMQKRGAQAMFGQGKRRRHSAVGEEEGSPVASPAASTTSPSSILKRPEAGSGVAA